MKHSERQLVMVQRGIQKVIHDDKESAALREVARWTAVRVQGELNKIRGRGK